jgi:hypothetical protein
MKTLVLALALVATGARAHTPSADELVASILEPAARAADGIERAERDPANPRVLVIRVGPAWFERAPEARATTAAGWYGAWRRTVPQGVVAVLDASGRVVVRFGRGGGVVGLRPG